MVTEVGARLLETRLGALEEDLQQLVHAEVVEQDHRVEAREKLRRHAVVEEILVAQPVAQVESGLLMDRGALDDGRRLESSPIATERHSVVDRVVEPLEGAGAYEPERRGVEGERPTAGPPR